MSLVDSCDNSMCTSPNPMPHIRHLFMKHRHSIKSRLSSFRDKHAKSGRQTQNVSLECLTSDQPIDEAQLTVPELRKNVYFALRELMRLMRSRSGSYLNLETDDIDNAALSNQYECNCAFLWAAYTCRTDLMQWLHEKNSANPSFAHPQANFNALHLAALSGSVDAVQWLLRQHCPILYTSSGLSPLHFAAYGKSAQVCRRLIEYGCTVDSTVLHAAAYGGDLECAALFLGLTSLPNAYDEYGKTALHIAVDLGNHPVVELLLDDPRIDVNCVDQQRQYTALHLAAENGYADCMQALLRKGAHVNDTTDRGHTALHLCCKQAFVDCVQLLLAHGANVNAQDGEKRTALHAAVSKSPWSLNIVRLLVEREANVNLADEFGYTCLHVAALNELDECVDYLILQGANVAARTKGNILALNIINRKTPITVKTISRRLDLAMSYKEQNLKLKFRDILRNSHVGETGFLHAVQKEGQSHILEHPLCQAFLHLKWQKVRAYIIIRVILSIITALLLSFYVLVCIRKGCDDAIAFQRAKDQYNLTETNCTASNTSSEDGASGSKKCYSCAGYPSVLCDNRLGYSDEYNDCRQYPLGHQVLSYPGVINWIRYFIFVVVGLNSIRLFFSLAAYRTFTKYFKKYLNILELVVTLSVLAMAIDVEQDDKFDLILPVGAGSVLCTWTYLMITIAQLPFFGTYVAMFNKVLQEFLKMFIAFFCLLVGFTFTFCVLKPDHFGNPLTGFVRVIGMMTGELNIQDVLNSDQSKGLLLQYTLLGIVWLFMILVTIVLMNLLVGIAVNDVEGLRKTADLSELIQQTKLIYFVELSCFEGYFPSAVKELLRRLLYVWPDSYTVALSVRPLNPHEKRLPKDIMNMAVEIAVRRTQARYKMNAKSPTIDKRLEMLEEHLKTLEEMLAKVSRNLSTLTGVDEVDGEEDMESINDEIESMN